MADPFSIYSADGDVLALAGSPVYAPGDVGSGSTDVYSTQGAAKEAGVNWANIITYGLTKAIDAEFRQPAVFSGQPVQNVTSAATAEAKPADGKSTINPMWIAGGLAVAVLVLVMVVRK